MTESMRCERCDKGWPAGNAYFKCPLCGHHTESSELTGMGMEEAADTVSETLAKRASYELFEAWYLDRETRAFRMELDNEAVLDWEVNPSSEVSNAGD